MIDRRSFLKIFTLAAAGAAVAPPLEKLVEVAAAEGHIITLAEADAAMQACVAAGIIDNWFRQSPILNYMKASRLERPADYSYDWLQVSEA